MMNTPVLTTLDTPPGAAAPVAAGRVAVRRERWLMTPAWRERLRAAGTVDWFNLVDDPRAAVVKADPYRQVWRVRSGAVDLFVKTFTATGWLDRLRRVVRGPEALREWRVGQYAASAGVPCVGLVACGVRRGASVLITEAAANAVDLTEAWRRANESHDACHETRPLIRAVADLVARAHGAKFLHRDGHPGNILVGRDVTGSPAALYVDLYGASIGTDVSDQRAAVGLAQLDQWFRRRATQTQRLRFLKAYLLRRFGARAILGPQVRRWLDLVQHARQRHHTGLVGKRDRRVWRQGKYFTSMLLNDGWRAVVALRLRNRGEFPIPVHPDRSAPDWRQVLTASTTPPDTVVIRWRAAGPVERFAWRCSGSPARRMFATAHGLRHRDVPCVWLPAMLERRTLGGVSECQALAERRPDCQALSDLIAAGGTASASWSDEPRRRTILESVGRLLAEATLAGVRWRKPCLPTLWVEGGVGESGRPQALLGAFGGINLQRGPDAAAGAIAVLDLAQSTRLDRADRHVLLSAFRRRMGTAFRATPDWEEEQVRPPRREKQ